MDTDEDDDAWPEKIGPLPKTLHKRPSWDDFESVAAMAPRGRKPGFEVTREQLLAGARAAGLAGLPPSYVEYCQRLGDLFEWRLAYKKERFPLFLNIGRPDDRRLLDLKDLRKTFKMRLEDRMKWGEPERVLSQTLLSLIPFGSDASGTDICWDPSQLAEKGELGICFIDRQGAWDDEKEVRTDVGTHLLDVLKYYAQRA